MTGKELYYIASANFGNKLSGDGIYSKKCHSVLSKMTGSHLALLTHSCTAALEMAAILLDIEPGDEVIFPSYTFVSTVNAFVLRGAKPVFVDIKSSTLNIDEQLIEKAISSRTRAIVAVHYAGVSCEMEEILDIGRQYKIRVVEDAAQGIMANYKGKPLGGIGDLGTFSFHETKNIISGEGGCLLINDETFSTRAEIIREKGTDRSKFFRGEVDKYTWQDIGSSFLPGEITAAFLFAQLEEAETITAKRLKVWNTYHTRFEYLEQKELVRRPIVPAHCKHNAHMYYMILANHLDRDKFIFELKKKGISTVFHYVPLHSSPVGKKIARISGVLKNTDDLSSRLVRIPLYIGLSRSEIDYIIESINEVASKLASN